MPTFSTTIPTNHEAVSQLRHDAQGWIRSELPDISDSTATDVGLVLTELAANVVDHTAAPSIQVEVGFVERQATIDVSSASAAASIPAVESWGDEPGDEPSGERGHGLRLIRALCSTVEVSGNDKHSRVRCVLDFD